MEPKIVQQDRPEIRTDIPVIIKPFRLVKYIALSTLMVIMVGTIILSSFISEYVKNTVLKKREQYAYLLAENLNHRVFFQFTLPTLLKEKEIRIRRPSQYTNLDRVVRNTIQGLAIEQVNIYDHQQVLSYSTDPDLIGTKGDLGKIFDRVMAGDSLSLQTPHVASFMGLTWGEGERKLKTYMPMWVERPLSNEPGKILAVFEITQDVTEDHLAILHFQRLLTGGFLAFITVISITLLFFSRRAEKAIEARAAQARKLQEQLQQAERLAALGQMIAGVSHEIRNPLGIIQSTAELLHSRLDNERHKKLSGVIMEETSRLNDILTEFLDFARPKNLKAVDCRIEDLVDRNLQVMEPECEKLDVKVQREYHTGDYTLEADPDLLYRAFVNLLVNALQAMPDGGTLKVITKLALTNGKEDPRIEVRIEDTGKGIPEEVRKQMFNPFFTTREKGTGLGLAIVRSIIDSHKGEIEVENRDGAGGARVILRLPLKQPRDAGDRETSA